MATLPPLPHVPEPPIFDAPYYADFLAIFDDASFPPTASADEIYAIRCQFIAVIVASRKGSSRDLSIALLVAWVSMVLLCGVLLSRIRHNRQRALQGDPIAARKIILPAFEPLLWTLGALNLGCILGYGALLVAKHYLVYHNRVAMELAVSAKHINALLVVMYMIQPSLAPRALAQAIVLALVLSGYTVPVVVVLNIVATTSNQCLCYWALVAARSLRSMYMIYLFVRPPTRASALSFRFLCLYVLIMDLLMFGMAEAYHRGRGAVGSAIGWTIAAYSMLLPLCVWRVLRADTEHWRGVGKRAVELQDSFRRKRTRMHERVSSQGLHVLIEMHRKFIIDFARLQLYEPITASGSVTVYRGFLHSKRIPVAIKVNMPSEFTDETVAAFSHEAAMCGALVHPNIVTFHGLCVCPPNICLVTELCQSSLADVLKTQGAHPCTQHMLVDIGYMLDAARALAYLHSFSPPFVHGGITPSIFLVDNNGAVKLTDFGASRTLVTTGGDSSASLVDEPESFRGRRTILEMPLAGDTHGYRTAEYVAPEVIRGRHAGSNTHSEAADVFALAMTMWDILHPNTTKYPQALTGSSMSSFRRTSQRLARDLEIYEAVLNGHRPPMHAPVPSGLRQLIDTAWHPNPRMRPSTRAIVTALESIQNELCAPFALTFLHGWNDCELSETDTVTSSFIGAQAVTAFQRRDIVASESQAIRLGGMLVDCGFLHHTKHARSFGNTESQFVLDAHEILASHRVAILESALSANETPRQSEAAEAVCARDNPPSDVGSLGVLESHCACRKLGQRVEPERATRSRFGWRFNLFSTEHAVTARLLANDSSVDSDFAAFRDPYQRRKRHRTAPPPSDVV